MPALLTIGEFSRASYLTIKTLRNYDDVGALRTLVREGPTRRGA
jgi:DNA-binding transcriptional MerR regulator